MRNSIRLAAVGTMLAGAAFTTTAQAATTAQADARAEILTTLAAAATQALDFGQIAANGAGTATVGADGSLACDAALVCTGTRLPAPFDVTGTADVGVTATVTDASIDLVNASDNTVTMTVDGFGVYFPLGRRWRAGLPPSTSAAFCTSGRPSSPGSTAASSTSRSSTSKHRPRTMCTTGAASGMPGAAPSRWSEGLPLAEC